MTCLVPSAQLSLQRSYSQIHLKDGEEASAVLGHSDKRNSQSQTIGFCQQKDLAGGDFVFTDLYAL